jgi:hypothetical protein
MQLAPQDIQLVSKHRVLSFKPQLRLEWQGQDGQKETEQPDHFASLSDSTSSSTRMRFSVHKEGTTSPVMLQRLCGQSFFLPDLCFYDPLVRFEAPRPTPIIVARGCRRCRSVSEVVGRAGMAAIFWRWGPAVHRHLLGCVPRERRPMRRIVTMTESNRSVKRKDSITH